MSQKKLSLIEWLDDQVDQGNEVIIKWDGGNDSGWVHMEIDGEDVDNEYTNAIINYMDQELNYGSWAGEFDANGEAMYDSKEKAFVGTDYYSETAVESHKVDIEILIPKHLWFDQLQVHVECNSSEEDVEVEVDFGIKNGFLTEEHQEVLKTLTEDLKEKIEASIEDWQDHTGNTLDSIWDDIIIPFSDFKVEGDTLVTDLEHLDFRYPETEEKDIYLDVKQVQEKIKEYED